MNFLKLLIALALTQHASATTIISARAEMIKPLTKGLNEPVVLNTFAGEKTIKLVASPAKIKEIFKKYHIVDYMILD